MRIALMVARARESAAGMWRNIPIPPSRATSRIACIHTWGGGRRQLGISAPLLFYSGWLAGSLLCSVREWQWEGDCAIYHGSAFFRALLLGLKLPATRERDWLWWKWTDYSEVSDLAKLAAAKNCTKFLPKLLVRRCCRRTSVNSVNSVSVV